MDINALTRSISGGANAVNSAEQGVRNNAQQTTANRVTNDQYNEKVTLTSTASHLNSLSTESKTTPVNSERVADIRALVADGNYQINANNIAERLVSFEKMLSA